MVHDKGSIRSPCLSTVLEYEGINCAEGFRCIQRVLHVSRGLRCGNWVSVDWSISGWWWKRGALSYACNVRPERGV